MARRRFLIIGIALAAALCARAAEAEIRIATASAMTGFSAWFGEQYQRAADLAVADLNARGGVLGQRVELVVGDDSATPIRGWLWLRSWSAMASSSSPGIFARTHR
jgi:branched-chain amino acid transport system substrate-binding protein